MRFEPPCEIKEECLKCKSKNVSNGKNDFIYFPEELVELPIQFCSDCNEEWFVKEQKTEGERQ